jgi:hypothetical protein
MSWNQEELAAQLSGNPGLAIRYGGAERWDGGYPSTPSQVNRIRAKRIYFCYELFYGASKNPLRVALALCDAHCTLVQLRFSTTIAAARSGF